MNCVITNLHHYLFEILKIKESQEILELWCDNTTRENKNFYLFYYLWSLVYFGYFSKIQIGFMLTGHTHCDIDRCFGIWKNQLFGGKKQNKEHIGCLEEVVEFTSMNSIEQKTGRSKRFTTITYEFVNWKSFFGRYFSTLTDITKYQMFEIKKNEILACVNFSKKFENFKEIYVPSEYPKTMQEVEEKTRGCGFKALSDELKNNIHIFKSHLQSCPKCKNFWSDVEKEAMEIEDDAELQISGSLTQNFSFEDSDDENFVPDDENEDSDEDFCDCSELSDENMNE